MCASSGQSSQYIDHLFTGDVLGKESDIGSGALRGWEFRKFDHLVGDFAEWALSLAQCLSAKQ